MMCSHAGCLRPNYGAYSECILHCVKSEYYDNDSHDQRFYFYYEFIRYITEKITNKANTFQYQFGALSSLEVQRILTNFYEFRTKESSPSNFESACIESIKSKKIIIHDIVFPPRDERDPDDWKPLLELFKAIEFHGGTFSDTVLEYLTTAIFYAKCSFLLDFTVSDYIAFENADYLPIFRDCTFYDDVSIYGSSNSKLSIKRNVFEDCNFKHSLNIEFATFDNYVFIDVHRQRLNIKTLTINNCSFKKPFKLNRYKIDALYLSDINFEDKFELKASNIKEFKQNNCNFEKVADFFETTFQSFSMEKSVFNGFAAFEDTEFGIHEIKRPEPAIFKYVTFEDFSNFRCAKFNDGLDIEKSNFAQPPNFLDAKLPLRNTPRETFRIIKNSFDSVGNYLEANSFFSLEMKKMRQSMQLCDFNGLVFWINDAISGFGQSYVRPLMGVVLISFLIAYFAPGYHLGDKVCTGEHMHFYDKWACAITPLKSFLIPGFEGVSLLVSIVYSILIWQTLVAVKRLTRR